MKIMRPLGAVGIAASAFLLAACGSDPAASNSSASSPAAPAASGTAQVDCGGKSPLSGEGSTAQKNAIDVFTLAYGKQCSGQQVNYTASGSGAGVKQFNGNQVDFGGSDSPVTGADLEAATKRCASPAWNIPMVVGPVAVAYKLQGVDKLTLTPTVIAKIFNGGIKNWNDPAIKAVKGNESLSFPDKPIQVVSRSDESGTTDNFQKYLAASAPQTWTKGAGKEFQGGAGEGAQKSSGVVQAIQATPGAIGYVEKSPAAAAGLPTAQIDNGGGGVALTDDTAKAAIGTAKFAGDGMDLKLDLNSIYATKAAGAYPLILATYEIVCSKGYDADTAAGVKSFLTVSSNQGQANLSTAGYVPLPDALKERLLKSVDAIA